MITYILIAILHINAGTDGDYGYGHRSASNAVVAQEFTSKANCVAAGEFLMASHEELYEANSARYTCLTK